MKNLKNIKLVESTTVEIKDPVDGTPTGVLFELAGPQHPDRKRITFAQSRKALKRYEKIGRIEMPDPEEAEATRLENLAAYTLGWSGFVGDDGAPIPFSKPAALDLYRDPEMGWLVDQLDTALGDKELFIRRSVTN